MFSIHSCSSSRELVFSAYEDERFRVTLKDMEIFVSTEVWLFPFNPDLNVFFQQLAGYQKPWQGELCWASLESEFEISATCSTVGHVNFQLKLSAHPGATEAWQVQAGLDAELGQLETIARNAKQFFYGKLIGNEC